MGALLACRSFQEAMEIALAAAKILERRSLTRICFQEGNKQEVVAS